MTKFASEIEFVMNPLSDVKINRLRKMLEGARNVALVSHTHPDGDAVGSTTAFTRYLRESSGMDAVAVFPDPYPDFLGFMAGQDNVIASSDPELAGRILSGCDLLICLDMNGFSRSGVLEDTLRSLTVPKILVDHHLNPDSDSFDLVFSDTEVSSASELLYWILMGLEGTDDASVLPAGSALSLMTGMTTDTNNFANSVYPTTLTMASALLAAGVDRDMIICNLYNQYRENRIRAMGYILDSLLKITDDGVAYVIITEEVRKRFDLQDGETEGFVNIPLGIGRVRISILLKEDKGYYRVSIRSMKGISANRLAMLHFNGGGHECAAGGRLYFPKDIATRDGAAEYIEKVTARFMQESVPQ